ncbi:hypothetical protein A2303_05995 [Candidatus Falkowbacteria bacterium RIFOXYB2_FULL_47_14]|uniref:Glycosyltransferase 2-like domain-containing protein n=1 Tax=Candidatus Falkowbacteria bacterium RIFOXYA2_FULL_47_19 TaxID=1797994 RepID=A0A1F5SMJ6_9BACT|nr:MAG: hypothetical protein A2227_04665 [Candidatus Falkowbacteria bacterium RIFOXYA2_FULL_47_19]OGF35981.1 MAG: hypothetical protein A2468_00360 [Candidatus Falkowbacteria bacterium RIFOXYC2_FULL_46_15]OGF42770.1 MAG: hypothetical protein A2303_05995 [Candidatus Falkowbacteria bacterium RIFOXYB2_FULL_47_14]
MEEGIKKLPKIFCVIPAFNEEDKIAATVNSVKPYVQDIIVVDDGSRDHTHARALRTGAVVLRHIVNRGQGAALQTGSEFALKSGADIIVHFDADGQFLASEIKDMISPLIRGECDVVFGSRFMSKKSNLPWFKKNIIYPVSRIVNDYLLSGSKLSDPQNGFRALSRLAAERINIQNDGMAHNSEIQKKTAKNFSYREVPVTVKYSAFGQGIFSGKGRGAGGFKILIDLFLSKLTDQGDYGKD